MVLRDVSFLTQISVMVAELTSMQVGFENLGRNALSTFWKR